MFFRKRITRRDFLTGTLFVCGLFAINNPILFADNSDENREFEEKLVGLIEHRESARVIGLEYLKHFPGEDNKDKLLSSIYTALKNQSSISLNETTSPQLNELLLTCRQKDFKKGRVVELQGWLLSITEAQLCALVAKQSPVFKG